MHDQSGERHCVIFCFKLKATFHIIWKTSMGVGVEEKFTGVLFVCYIYIYIHETTILGISFFQALNKTKTNKWLKSPSNF